MAHHTPSHMHACAQMEVLIARGADVDACDGDGQTALHYAATNDHQDIVRVLVRAGCDVHAADSDGACHA